MTMKCDIEYKDLIVDRPYLYIAKFMLWLSMISAGLYLMHLQEPWLRVIGVLSIALGFAHGIELQHQALHGTGTANRKADMKMGFFLGLPLFISIHHYQDRHLHHHQHVGTESDSEFFQYAKDDNHRILRFLANLLMLPHWLMVVKLIWRSWMGLPIKSIHNKKNEPSIRTDYAIMGAMAILVAAILIYFCINPFVLMAFPIASCIHTLVEMPEHWGCTKNASVFENTRTIRGGMFVTWLTNGNNYHVEHHLAPALRPEALRDFHERIRSRIFHQHNSYVEFLQACVRNKDDK